MVGCFFGFFAFFRLVFDLPAVAAFVNILEVFFEIFGMSLALMFAAFLVFFMFEDDFFRFFIFEFKFMFVFNLILVLCILC